MAFFIYTTIALLVTMSVLRAGCSNNEIDRASTTAILFVSALSWIGLIWYFVPPKNFYIGVICSVVAFEIALFTSGKAVSRWKSLGYIK